MNEQTHTTITPNAAEAVHFHWRSVAYAAKYYGRVERVIQRWCKNGTLASAKIPVFRDVSGRWWICLPASEDKECIGVDFTSLTPPTS